VPDLSFPAWSALGQINKMQHHPSQSSEAKTTSQTSLAENSSYILFLPKASFCCGLVRFLVLGSW